MSQSITLQWKTYPGVNLLAQLEVVIELNLYVVRIIGDWIVLIPDAQFVQILLLWISRSKLPIIQLHFAGWFNYAVLKQNLNATNYVITILHFWCLILKYWVNRTSFNRGLVYSDFILTFWDLSLDTIKSATILDGTWGIRNMLVAGTFYSSIF